MWLVKKGLTLIKKLYFELGQLVLVGFWRVGNSDIGTINEV